MVRRCEFCDSPVPADATYCPVCKEEIAEEVLERILPMLKRPDAPDVRVMGPIDRMWGVIRRPAAAYRDIGQKPDAFGPFIIIILNALVLAGFFIAMGSKFTVLVPGNNTQYIVGILESDRGGIVYLGAMMTIIPSIMLGFFYLVIGSAFAHLAFKITGGIGKRSKTVSIVGYSMLPVILFRVLAILIVLVSVGPIPIYSATSGAVTIPQIIAAIGTLYTHPMWLTIDYLTTASFAWVGFLLIFGIREAHETSTVWAAFISVMCMLVMIWTFWQVH